MIMNTHQSKKQLIHLSERGTAISFHSEACRAVGLKCNAPIYTTNKLNFRDFSTIL
jgi:hypothetical protein